MPFSERGRSTKMGINQIKRHWKKEHQNRRGQIGNHREIRDKAGIKDLKAIRKAQECIKTTKGYWRTWIIG